MLPNTTSSSVLSTSVEVLVCASFTDITEFDREELAGNSSYAGDKGLSKGLEAPALLKK